MTRAYVCLVLGLLTTIPISGCGRNSDPDRPAVNRVLGDGVAAAPLSVARVDSGILKDQTAYQPAKFESMSPVAVGGGGDSDSVASVVKGVLASVSEGDLIAMLDAFVPDQVAALTDDTSSIERAVDSAMLMMVAYQNKTANRPPEQAAAIAQLNELPKKIFAALGDALRVELIDADHAVVTVDDAKMQESMATILAEAGPALAAMGAPLPGAGMPGIAGAAPAEPAAATPTGASGRTVSEPPKDANKPEPPAAPATPGGAPAIPGMPPGGGFSPEMLAGMMGGDGDSGSLKLLKVDGAWKIDIEHTITEDEAALVDEACDLVRDLCDRLYAQIEAAETLDDQAFQMMAMQTAMPMTGQFMALFARFQMLVADADLEAAAPPPVEAESQDEPEESGLPTGPRRP